MKGSEVACAQMAASRNWLSGYWHAIDWETGNIHILVFRQIATRTIRVRCSRFDPYARILISTCGKRSSSSLALQEMATLFDTQS